MKHNQWRTVRVRKTDIRKAMIAATRADGTVDLEEMAADLMDLPPGAWREIHAFSAARAPKRYKEY